MNADVEALFRRLTDARDDEAATRFITAAKRHYPSLNEAFRALEQRGHTGILHGNRHLGEPQALQQLEGCVAVFGHLQLGPALAQNPAALEKLVYVAGDLFIHRVPSTHLHELPSLRSVGGRLVIESNANLQSLNGLQNLLECAHALILDNPHLQHLTGLRNLLKCTTLRILLEPHTTLSPADFPNLQPQHLLLLRWAPLNEGRWHLRHLAAHQKTASNWLERAYHKDTAGDTESHNVRQGEGGTRMPNQAPRALLGCQIEGRATLICPIYPGRMIIGRAKFAEIELQVATLARQHLAIQHQAGVATAIHYGSPNGIYHNGTRIQRADLKDGDQLNFGHVQAFYWDLFAR